MYRGKGPHLRVRLWNDSSTLVESNKVVSNVASEWIQWAVMPLKLTFICLTDHMSMVVDTWLVFVD